MSGRRFQNNDPSFIEKMRDWVRALTRISRIRYQGNLALVEFKQGFECQSGVRAFSEISGVPALPLSDQTHPDDAYLEQGYWQSPAPAKFASDTRKSRAPKDDDLDRMAVGLDLRREADKARLKQLALGAESGRRTKLSALAKKKRLDRADAYIQRWLGDSH